MKSHKLFQKLLMMSVIVCGMASSVSASDQQVTEAVGGNKDACLSGEKCAILNPKGPYLTESFVETYEVDPKKVQTIETTKHVAANGDRILATSRPAGIKAVSVKDKKKKMVQTQVFSDGVAVKTPAVIQINEKTGVKKEKEEKREAPKTVVKKEIVQPSSSKKVRTTITETTKRMKKKNPVKKVSSKDPKTMTLLDKLDYGEAVQNWEAPAGETLRSLLMKWGEQSGWTVVWKLDRDYHLEAGVVFRGNFVDASGAIVRSFARATPAPIGTFYKGNRVLVISTQEDENER